MSRRRQVLFGPRTVPSAVIAASWRSHLLKEAVMVCPYTFTTGLMQEDNRLPRSSPFKSRLSFDPTDVASERCS